MPQPVAIMRGNHVYTLKPWPARVDNPGKWRWMVYRDGLSCGAVRNKADFEAKVNSGWWDQEEPGVVEV